MTVENYGLMCGEDTWLGVLGWQAASMEFVVTHDGARIPAGGDGAVRTSQSPTLAQHAAQALVAA